MIGLLLITHDRIGEELVAAATTVVGNTPLPTRTMACAPDCDPKIVLGQARSLTQALNQGDGVLVLSDLYGSTPGNIAAQLAEKGVVEVVSGVNLPMVLRVFNYARHPLEHLAKAAVAGGQRGILLDREEFEAAP